MSFLLSTILFFDFKERRIPNICLLGIVLLYGVDQGSKACFDPLRGINVLILGLGSFGLKKLVEYTLHHPALGKGDIKLMMALGLWLPSSHIPAFLVFSGLTGCLSAKYYQIVYQKRTFPFAPCLILGFLSALILYKEGQ